MIRSTYIALVNSNHHRESNIRTRRFYEAGYRRLRQYRAFRSVLRPTLHSWPITGTYLYSCLLWPSPRRRGCWYNDGGSRVSLGGCSQTQFHFQSSREACFPNNGISNVNKTFATPIVFLIEFERSISIFRLGSTRIVLYISKNESTILTVYTYVDLIVE